MGKKAKRVLELLRENKRLGRRPKRRQEPLPDSNSISPASRPTPTAPETPSGDGNKN